LLSQKVEGNPVHKVWDNPQVFNKLDPIHTELLIIAAMLMNPEDGQEDNFILSEDGKYLIPIDNDHYFLLDQLVKIQDKYNNLMREGQHQRFLEHGTITNILFYEQFISHMYWKAHKIKDILTKASEPTPFDLLKSVEPFAARCYEESFQQKEDPQSRFKAATKQLYTKPPVNGNRVSVFNMRTFLEIVNISEKDLQNDALFQRLGSLDTLDLLERLIQERDEKTQKEQELLCELDDKNEEGFWASLFGNPLLEANLKDFFTNPKEGLALKGSKLIVSSKLRALFALAPDQGARIKFLSLPNSPLLTHRTVRTLVKGCPNIEYLNVSGCAKLQEIITGRGEWPLLVRIEAKDCFTLEKFVSGSPIRILRIGTTWKIEISIEEFCLDILDVFMENRQFDFHLKKGQGFGIKSINKPLQNFRLRPDSRDILSFYFQEIKIQIGNYSISSGEDFRSLISFFEMRDDIKDPLFSTKRDELSLFNFPTEIYSFLLSSSPETLLHSGNLIFAEFMLFLGGWPLLEKLTLCSPRISWERVLNLFLRGGWPQLRYLSLLFNGIDREGIEMIFVQNRYISQPLLETLDLSSTNLTAKDLIPILLSVCWPNLKEIIFAHSDSIGQDQVRNLLPANWPLIERLDLSNLGRIETEIMESIIKPRWPQLKCLDMSNNHIFEEEFAILSQGDWPLLETLKLTCAKVITKEVM